ncbi:hypothetical protein EDD28_2844 [Salana multivorans]|uniref:Uncharacterized protein n=1 Tax=Salana multivorans TaxID=120377 RepID=A0A3N2D101_9MICO|nr:hypothetical protein [Salana multivorans]MBN8882076.1 hypothetical protein [Salana multivorans]ROR93431.1 hypothetical protein EDD28_2844 [Salana multivorans]
MADKDLTLISPGGDRVPAVAPFHNEGKTPAAWVMAWGLMLAAVLIAVGLIARIDGVWIAGVVVGLVSLVASGAMRAAGLGQPPVSVQSTSVAVQSAPAE